MKHDNKFRIFLKRWEGMKLKAYQCSAYVWTLGLGSTRYPDGTPVKQGDRLLSEDEAWELFENTIRPYEEALKESITVPLNQCQYNALLSFIYNVGIGAFKSSTLLKRLNAGLLDDVPGEFLRWDKVSTQRNKGLTNRRIAEAGLFQLPMEMIYG